MLSCIASPPLPTVPAPHEILTAMLIFSAGSSTSEGGLLSDMPPKRSVGEAVEEIAEYVTDADATVARAAVSAIGKMGVKVPACGDVVVDQLMKFLEVDIDHVTAEAIISEEQLSWTASGSKKEAGAGGDGGAGSATANEGGGGGSSAKVAPAADP